MRVFWVWPALKPSNMYPFHQEIHIQGQFLWSFLKKKGNKLCSPQQGHVLFKKEAAIKTPRGRLTDTALGIVHQSLTKRQADTSEMTGVKTEIAHVQSARSRSRNDLCSKNILPKVLNGGGMRFTDVSRGHKGRKSSRVRALVKLRSKPLLFLLYLFKHPMQGGFFQDAHTRKGRNRELWLISVLQFPF